MIRHSDIVDPACPLNWDHPLLKGGILGWWMAPPNSGWSGGNTLRDLVRGGKTPNDGTLTNIDTPSAWVGTPFGRGVKLDGTNDYIALPAVGNGTTGTSDELLSIHVWLRVNLSARCFAFSQNFTAGPQLTIETNGELAGGVPGVQQFRTTTTVADGSYIQLSYSHKAASGTHFIWVNGVPITLNSQNSATAWTFNGSPKQLGARDTTPNVPATATILGCMLLMGRYHDTVEVADLYQQWRSGFPETWNWYRPKTWSIPAGSSVHDLTATGIATSAPSLGTPALTQVHALTADGISCGAPSCGTPALTQVHALTATEIATGAPSCGNPAVTQTHALTANGIDCGTPTLGTPAISQTHALIADGIATGSPSCGTPAIAQVHALTADNITSGTPAAGSPAVAQIHALIATALDAGAPSLGTPSLAQVHALSASPIVCGSPSLGSPRLGGRGGRLLLVKRRAAL